jgi:transposase
MISRHTWAFAGRFQQQDRRRLRCRRPLGDFVLAAGQAHELAASLLLLKRLPKAPMWATEHAREGLADMACDAAAFRAAARAMGANPVVPSRKNAKQPQPCPAFIYRHRNLIERCWSRLKERRAIATRYDKTATSYAAGIAIAATLDWFKSSG